MIRRPIPTAAMNDFHASKVLAGFLLQPPASGLTATISAGVLYANGVKFAPTAAPTLPACSATAGTYYLWYNATTGFYWNSSGTVPTTAGDCLLGSAVVASSVISSTTSSLTINDPALVASGGVAQIETPWTAGASSPSAPTSGGYHPANSA